MTDKLLAYMDEHEIGEDELLFPYSRLLAEWETTRLLAEPRRLADMPPDLPRTPRNKYGKTYRHGTTGGYGPGGCRCDWCRLAIAEYRAKRRAEGKDRPPTGHSRRGKNVTDHLPDDWFREKVWKPTLSMAGFLRRIVFYDLRHSHATWLLTSAECRQFRAVADVFVPVTGLRGCPDARNL